MSHAKHLTFVAPLALALACGDSEPASPDAGTTPPVDAGDDLNGGDPDPDEPGEFEELELRVSPESPIPEHEFSLYIRAVDTNGNLYEDYEGVVTVEASEGELLGPAESQTLTQGTAFLDLRFDDELEDVTLTVTDDDDSSLRYETESFDVAFHGEPGEPGDVVISEVNWFGPLANNQGTMDVWVELRNVSGRELNVSQWRLAGAGVEGNDVFLFSDTVLDDDDHLVVTNFVTGSIDGENEDIRTQLHLFVVPLELPTDGMRLVLEDVAGTVIDETPDPSDAGGWPAGLADFDLGYFKSMQRRDDITGGGYGDGSDPGEWYTWNRAGGPNTTAAGTPDRGSPGFPNTDPEARGLPLPYATSFEPGDPRLEFVDDDHDADIFHVLPPDDNDGEDDPPLEPREGNRFLSTTSVAPDIDGRSMRTVDCLALDGDEPVEVEVFGMGSADNDHGSGEAVRLRTAIEWYPDEACDDGDRITTNVASPQSLPNGEYHQMTQETPVAGGATHIRVRLDVQIDPEDIDEGWAADDLSVQQAE